MSGSKLRFLTLQEKLDVINKKDSNPYLSLRKLGEEFKCSKSQISNILCNKNEIRKACMELKDKSRKKLKRSTPNDAINDLTWEWFQFARAKGVPVSGPVLQEKAKMFADILGNETFGASNGWLESFRKRNGIAFSVDFGNDLETSEQISDDWEEKLINRIVIKGQPPVIITTDSADSEPEESEPSFSLVKHEAISLTEGLVHLQKLQLFCNQQGFYDISDQLYNIHEEIETKSLLIHRSPKQALITSYFNKQ